MVENAQIKQAILDLNDATNGAAARVEALTGKISTGMSDADVAEAKAEIDVISNRLRSLAADPNQPVPPEQPAGTGAAPAAPAAQPEAGNPPADTGANPTA